MSARLALMSEITAVLAVGLVAVQYTCDALRTQNVAHELVLMSHYH